MANPVRLSRSGQVMDFSRAIKWYLSDPGNKPPKYGLDSPLHLDWERRKKAHDMEGQNWARYLIPQGRVGERRTEGAIITNIRITKTIQDGYNLVGGANKQTSPKYKTISTTKEVLLKNTPEEMGPNDTDLSWPVFAFPLGMMTVGTVMLEAYDYGIPCDPRPLTPEQIKAAQDAAHARAIADKKSHAGANKCRSLASTPSDQWRRIRAMQSRFALSERARLRDKPRASRLLASKIRCAGKHRSLQ